MNRKQRRAQASDNRSPEDIPLARPSENGSTRQAKTLYEIAAERQAALSKDNKQKFDAFPDPSKIINVKIGTDGKVEPVDKDALPDLNQPIPLEEYSPILDTLLLSVSLSVLHFTLEALTIHQYAEKLVWKHVFWHTVLQAFPILTLLIHFMHGHLISTSVKLNESTRAKVHIAKQLFYIVLANIAGCYLIQLTNDQGFMAVMKNAPSIGTIWVWCVIELGPVGALAGVAGPGAYAWWYGYGIY